MIKTLIANKFDNIDNFQTIVNCILRHIPSLPIKKQSDLVKIIANRPGNFHFVNK